MIDPELKFKNPFKISHKERKKIIEILKDLLFPMEDILFAYLFGSFAEGLRFHDIDIAIFGKETFELSELIDYSNFLERAFHYPVHLVDLNAVSPGFQMEILSKGILLFSKDEELRTDFIEKVSLKYREYAHFRNLSLGIEGLLS
ncbi:nucleotidyltransferase [Caldimicrobium thiodismutans]|uniref:Nucleotidyltransferase n=1 Tax=Caldimicrobium thiodismutans TaxID=1653476 RepID=A0A0U5AX03_9BACT|nr:nucleotidyltransferase domain-containing protein [Caldimicrobium thiodismutans]BAU22959.1 nucleotidyltransferase [Caldimicrobium thiodismutans]